MGPGSSQGISNNPYLDPILVLIPIYLRSILILSSHLRLGLPKGLFPAGFKELLPSSILAIWFAHLNLLDLITLTTLYERCKRWSSSLWSFLHSPFSSLFGPNIRLRILISNTLSLHSSLNVRDHVYNVTLTLHKCFFFSYASKTHKINILFR